MDNTGGPPITGFTPEKPVLSKRKAAAKNTPSGVDRLNQNPKVDANTNAGNIQSMHSNREVLMSMGDPPVPPVLERSPFFHNNEFHSIGDMSTGELVHGLPWGSPDYINLEAAEGMTSFSADGAPSLHCHELDDILNEFSGVDVLNHEGGLQANDDFYWIPSEMKLPSFLPGYKLSMQYSSRMPLGERVGLNLNLNTAEDHMMFGPNGILRTSMSMWNREKGRYGQERCCQVQSRKILHWERLEQF